MSKNEKNRNQTIIIRFQMCIIETVNVQHKIVYLKLLLLPNEEYFKINNLSTMYLIFSFSVRYTLLAV